MSDRSSDPQPSAEARLTIVARGVMGRYACDALAPSHEHDDSDCQNCRMERRIVEALRAREREALERAARLDKAVEKFLTDATYTPPWESAAGKWGAMLKALNEALCDYREVPPLGDRSVDRAEAESK